MIKATITMIATLMVTGLLASSVYAAPITLNSAQMDGVAAGGDHKVDGFVCPVIKTDAVLNSPKGAELGIEGYYTIGGPDVRVPQHATNDNGEGSPSGPFAAPGDTSYTAIWKK